MARAGDRIAWITGAGGQDGPLLARLLAGKGYSVHGTTRGGTPCPDSVSAMHACDLTERDAVAALFKRIPPDEVYHLAGQSDVGLSMREPLATLEANGMATAVLLDVAASCATPPRVFHASSAHVFAGGSDGTIHEGSPRAALSPYAIGKACAHDLVVFYRDTRNLHASNGILFNHESTRRPDRFVTRKITRGMAALACGKTTPLRVGSMDAARDWSAAEDIVEAMWRMLQQDEPEDYVLASGTARTVRAFIETAARCAGFDIAWQGDGADERGYRTDTGALAVRVDAELFRPVEFDRIVGDPTRARTRLNWTPATSFEDMVQRMVEADIAALRSGPEA